MTELDETFDVTANKPPPRAELVPLPEAPEFAEPPVLPSELNPWQEQASSDELVGPFDVWTGTVTKTWYGGAD
ncbi:hypothetical protein LCGC14_2446540, partial [marine sediment metagenome]